MSSDIEGWILAGGRSSRMGSDKCDLALGNRTFWDLVSDALSAVAGERIYIAGGPARNSRWPIIPDPPPFADGTSFAGPLVGLHTALSTARLSWVAVIACDLPFVTGDVFRRLASLSEGADAVVPMQADGRPQPLCALYRCEACLPAARNVLTGRDRSMRSFIDTINTHFVPFSEFSGMANSDRLFLNINSPDDYHRANMLTEGRREA